MRHGRTRACVDWITARALEYPELEVLMLTFSAAEADRVMREYRDTLPENVAIKTVHDPMLGYRFEEIAVDNMSMMSESQLEALIYWPQKMRPGKKIREF